MIVQFTELWRDEPHPPLAFAIAAQIVHLHIPVWPSGVPDPEGASWLLLSPPLALGRFVEHVLGVLRGPVTEDVCSLVSVRSPLPDEPALQYEQDPFRLRMTLTPGGVFVRAEGDLVLSHDLLDAIEGRPVGRRFGPAQTWISRETAHVIGMQLPVFKLYASRERELREALDPVEAMERSLEARGIPT